MPGPASSFDTYKSDIMNRPADKRAAAAERHLDLLTQMRSSLQQEFITRLEGTHRIMGNSRSYQSILETCIRMPLASDFTRKKRAHS